MPTMSYWISSQLTFLEVKFISTGDNDERYSKRCTDLELARMSLVDTARFDYQDGTSQVSFLCKLLIYDRVKTN
jgi:hypothetical protein